MTKLLIATIVLAALPLAAAEAQTQPYRDYSHSWRLEMQKGELQRRKRAREEMKRQLESPPPPVASPRPGEPLPLKFRLGGIRI
jgi:hypothetical protein